MTPVIHIFYKFEWSLFLTFNSENEDRFYIIVPDLNGSMDFVDLFSLYLYILLPKILWSIVCYFLRLRILFPLFTPLGTLTWSNDGLVKGPTSCISPLGPPSTLWGTQPLSRLLGFSGSTDLKCPVLWSPLSKCLSLGVSRSLDISREFMSRRTTSL